MTRNTPFPPPQEGYYAEPQNGYQQQQPHYGEPEYGQPQGNEGRPYEQYPSPSGMNVLPGQAQSYYGTNDQAYQPYPPNQSWNQNPEQYSSPGQYHHQPNYGPASNYNQQRYGQQDPSQQYPSQSTPLYNDYPPRPDDDLDTLRSHYDQPSAPPPDYTHPDHSNTNLANPADSASNPDGTDRGIMGALAGGAAGAYGGHKFGHHGILGGLGGAVAGSMLEDAYKKHRHDQQQAEAERHRLQQQQQQAPPVPPHPGHGDGNGSVVHAGNFRASSRHPRLVDQCTLEAYCDDVRGETKRARIDLNDCLTNTNGHFHWAAGGNFAASARNIRLVEDGRVLEADLGDGVGGWRQDRVWLDERITNDDGRLEFLRDWH